jgi:hypothetical protein
MYNLNSIPYGNVAKLIDWWTSEGLQTLPGLYCCACQNNPNIQAPSPLTGEVRLELADCQPPPHLYFVVGAASILGETHRQDFLGLQDWLFWLVFFGNKYTLLARGYWTGAHFRSKVVQKAVSGTLGVWLQDDQGNRGNAWLLDNSPSSIGGTSPNRKFVMYSRAWSKEEERFIDKKLAQIKKDHP